MPQTPERRKEYLRENKERIDAKGREWRSKNREHLRSYMHQWHLKNREKRRKQDRLRRLGITAEQFERKLSEQGGVCGLCFLPFSDKLTEAPRADHDHATGEFRGVLHRHCNLGLGIFNDDIGLFEKAIAYLRKRG